MTAATRRGWLLDTNIVSELRKGARCHPGVRSWAEAVPPAACFLSRITVAEVRFGIIRVTDPGFRAELEAWLRDGLRAWFGERILDVDEEVLLTWRRLAWEAQRGRFKIPAKSGHKGLGAQKSLANSELM